MTRILTVLMAAAIAASALAQTGDRPGQHFIENWDDDGDGRVTLAEFLGVTEAWFAGVDRNGDGVITTDDFGPRRGG